MGDADAIGMRATRVRTRGNLLLVHQARDYLGQGLAISSVHEEIYRRLRAAGIEIPCPVRRIVGEGEPPAPAASRARRGVEQP